MLARWVGAAIPLALVACSDAPPKIVCTPPSCAGKVCGYSECGIVCAPGSGCFETHRVTGGLSAGGGHASAAGGHAVGGSLGSAAAPTAAGSGGHSIGSGRVSP